MHVCKCMCGVSGWELCVEVLQAAVGVYSAICVYVLTTTGCACDVEA
jgi:hypothetical protein